ncbi:MAG: ABC transporter permease [Actinomycetota bacterium]|nr:ABC transporter permease [Actinomycetota bacterium]
MTGGDVIGWGALAGSLVFVAIALAVGWREQLGLTRPIVVAVSRSLAQMLVVGSGLVLVVDPDASIVWSWAWVVAIVLFASYTITRRAPEVPNLGPVALLSTGLVASVGLAFAFGLGVFELGTRTLVPVGGMVVGNSMKAAVVAVRRVCDSLAEHRPEIEAGLALGMDVRRASRRFVRASIRTAVTPQIEQTAGLGLMFLPGAMTGMILAGADPLEAVRAQLALMYILLAAVVTSCAVTAFGTIARLTTDDHRIVHLERATGT